VSRHPVSALAEYLTYLKDEGVTEVPVTRATLERVKRGAGAAPPAAPTAARPTPTAPPPPRERAPQAAPPREPRASAEPAPRAAPPQKTAPAGGAAELTRIAAEIAGCKRCELHRARTNTVPGQGHPNPDILFIGEAPGQDEDEQGLAFVGRAGQLLTRMIEAMGYTREQVFIANICKCRPPNNRPPEPPEMAACVPYLKRQIAALQPKVIVALGATSVKGLQISELSISKVRGHWHTYESIPLMPTFHPSYLLRNPAAKKEVWEDLKAVLQHLGRTPPPKAQG